MEEVGKREIESNITGRVSSGNTIKTWTQDVTKSDRKSRGYGSGAEGSGGKRKWSFS